MTTFSVATNDYRGENGERTEYHACVAWDRLAEICRQFLSKGQLVDVEGRLQTRLWDDDAGKGYWATGYRCPMTGSEIAPPSVRFVGGHYDDPDLFDLECRVLEVAPTEIVLQPLTSPATRIYLNSRVLGKSIGPVESASTTTVCTYRFDDDSHRGMATWSAREDGGVIVSAHDY